MHANAISLFLEGRISIKKKKMKKDLLCEDKDIPKKSKHHFSWGFFLLALTQFFPMALIINEIDRARCYFKYK